jgi:hypothetical protein
MHGLLWALGLIVLFTVMTIFTPSGRRELNMLICVVRAVAEGKGPDTRVGEVMSVDYARCLADWDLETQMTKREWHISCADAVKEEPGAYEPAPGNR